MTLFSSFFSLFSFPTCFERIYVNDIARNTVLINWNRKKIWFEKWKEIVILRELTEDCIVLYGALNDNTTISYYHAGVEY